MSAFPQPDLATVVVVVHRACLVLGTPRSWHLLGGGGGSRAGRRVLPLVEWAWAVQECGEVHVVSGL